MKKFVFICLFLTSCAFDSLDRGLPLLQGKSIDIAIDHLGLPDAEQNIAGRKVYIWGHQNSGTYMTPVTTYSNASAYGSGGYAYGSGTSTTYVPQSYNYQCTIKLIVNENDIIQSSEYSGNAGGCSAFQNGMYSIIENYETKSE